MKQNVKKKYRPLIASDTSNLTLDDVKKYILKMNEQDLYDFLEDVYQTCFGNPYGKWGNGAPFRNEQAIEWLFDNNLVDWKQEDQILYMYDR